MDGKEISRIEAEIKHVIHVPDIDRVGFVWETHLYSLATTEAKKLCQALREAQRRIEKLEKLIREAAPMTWAHAKEKKSVIHAYEWEIRAETLLEDK